MNLPQLEVYAIEKIGRNSAYGYLEQDGTRVVLKPKQEFSDRQVIRYLYEIQMQGIPHIWGETEYEEETYLIFSWLAGEHITEANLSNEQINQAIFAVLALIDRLHVITGMHWFFLDMKPQHIIIDSDGRVSLIDFEHVVVNKINQVSYTGFNQLGLSPIYCSAECRTGQFTRLHHEYALALIWLSLLSKTPIENLNARNRNKLLRKLDLQIKLRIESGLRGEGIRIKSKCSNDNLKNTEKQLNKELSEKTSHNTNDKANIEEETVQNHSYSTLQSTLRADTLQTVQKHMQMTLLKPSNNLICGYKEQRVFECHNSEKQELVILSGIKTIILCKCHVLPVLVDLHLAYFGCDHAASVGSEILQEINKFSGELHSLNLLTKNLASHIVKKYVINDLYISNEYLNLCGFTMNGTFAARQIQEYKSGKFATNSKLSNQVSGLKHKFWR
ncbi:MAG TPA: hypothetical protein GXZ43_02435 [Clostridiaceae bacterium]|nr:hypothetical protein [Clostridiaceae bacterium]